MPKNIKKWKKKIDNATDLKELNEEAKEEMQNLRPIRKGKKKAVTSLFSINTDPSKSMQKRLKKDRFRRQLVEGEFSKHEDLKVKKLAKKLANKAGEKAPEEKKPEVFDIWATEAKVTEPPKFADNSKKLSTPVLVPPHAGQSINPTLQSQKDLMELVVKQVEKKQGLYREKKLKPIKKAKKLTKKQKVHLERMQKIKAEKEKTKMENMAPLLTKQRDEAIEKHRKSRNLTLYRYRDAREAEEEAGDQEEDRKGRDAAH